MKSKKNSDIELKKYFELGNKASSIGELDESLKWFYRGLLKSKEFKNEIKIREFTTLILFTL
ncbi:MAG: hypothetical protein HRT57_04795 [Crocinitomicaceae bacterium]|nr:hypothetical protein [Crocinitomicaceae bacterium]